MAVRAASSVQGKRRGRDAGLAAREEEAQLGRARAIAQKIGTQRLELLRTRGLLVLRIPVPIPVQEVAMKWYTDPPDFTRTDLRVFIDGSVMYGQYWCTALAGAALVVVSLTGDLVAFGNARPPSSVRTAAAR